MRLKLGDREFDLKPLTLNDWIEGEDMGLDISRMGRKDVKLRDLRTIAYLAAKAAAPEDESITPEWVGKQINLGDKEVFEQLQNFISESSAPLPEST